MAGAVCAGCDSGVSRQTRFVATTTVDATNVQFPLVTETSVVGNGRDLVTLDGAGVSEP